jgi:transposase, IS5 family
MPEVLGLAELKKRAKAAGYTKISRLGNAGSAVPLDSWIDQARRRVLQGEQVPTAEKTYSFFETHTDLIKRGKVQTPIEFGHKVFLAESAQGLITQYEVLEGNPGDDYLHRRSRSPHP